MPLNAQTAKFVVAKKVREHESRTRTTMSGARNRLDSSPTKAGSEIET